MKLADIRIADIRIGNRHRHDLGDIEALAGSIREIGLLHPVVVNSDGMLIAGRRRIEACSFLGWTEIPATVLDLDSIIRGEHDENVYRKDFTPSEAVAIAAELEPMEREAAKERKATSNVERVNFTPSETGKALDRVAEAVGMSRPTLTKAREVVEFGDEELIEEMDRTGKVSGAHKKLIKKRQAEMESPPLPAGSYSVIYADPPWSYSNSGFAQSAAQHYPTMSTEDLCEMPIAAMCHPGTVLFMWATSPLLPEALSVLKAWGFTYKASLVWCKGKAPGMGWFVRTAHEFLLIGTREDNTHPRTRPFSVISAESGAHSKKPTEVYAMLEEMYEGPYVELFARRPVSGWEGWGNEADQCNS